MPYYLLEAAYTAEGWSALVRGPHDRVEILRPIVEELGGSIEKAWLAFGDYDVVAICQMPDNVSVAALSMAVSSGGAVKNFKTTILMTVEEGLKAMKRAATTG